MEKLQPERLYHYTTVESLALILKNKTLRLNPLNKMDDLQEAQSKSLQDYGQFVFVSSWTDMKEESIPMWKMYSSMEAGVRISLPPDPFQIFGSNPSVFRNLSESEQRKARNSPLDNLETEYVVVNYWKMLDQKCFPSHITYGHLLCKVEYTNDSDKLYPDIEHISDDKILIELDKLGKFKNESWKFQQEYRYRVLLGPGYDSDEIFSTRPSQADINILKKGQRICPIPYVDLHLDTNKLDDMIITMSPCISAANEIIVESLVHQFCPKAQIEKSALAGLVR